MPIKKIGSPDPKYLAATDILISDMSNISYDFLLFNRPIILLANEWLRKNFPDLGIKAGLNELEDAIKRSMENPEEFEESRKYWLAETIYAPDGASSKRILDEILSRSGYDNPFILLLHGDNEVSKVHLMPLYDEIRKSDSRVDLINFFNQEKYKEIKDLICISTHNSILENIDYGFKVHIDHSVKGAGVTDFEKQLMQYKEKGYFIKTDLHITEGRVSFEKTKALLGPYKDRAILAGYPKSDTLIKLNTMENKLDVYAELGYNPDKILITYAPTGKYRYPFKQGASLNNDVLRKLGTIARKNNYNILVKLRSRESLPGKIIKKIKNL